MARPDFRLWVVVSPLWEGKHFLYFLKNFVGYRTLDIPEGLLSPWLPIVCGYQVWNTICFCVHVEFLSMVRPDLVFLWLDTVVIGRGMRRYRGLGINLCVTYHSLLILYSRELIWSLFCPREWSFRWQTSFDISLGFVSGMWAGCSGLIGVYWLSRWSLLSVCFCSVVLGNACSSLFGALGVLMIDRFIGVISPWV